MGGNISRSRWFRSRSSHRRSDLLPVRQQQQPQSLLPLPPPQSTDSKSELTISIEPSSWKEEPDSYAPYPSYRPPQSYPPEGTSPNSPAQPLERRYLRTADNYRSLEQVTEALAQAGLESSNLILGIDFTKSNEWTGKYSFNRCSLHRVDDHVLNPYEQAISIIGRTLSAFDEDNYIPCYGFGDVSTHDEDVFSFYPDREACNGFEEALARYREIIPQLKLAGPTSFAPIIEMATTIVEQSGGQYHILLIIADGQVTRSVDTETGQLSYQEQKTVDAIVKASEFPLSIILVGVGDGPWEKMKEFDDNIPARAFDNFHFVNFTEIMYKNMPETRKETEFALAALMEIPLQYKATTELGLLGQRTTKSAGRVPLPPPSATPPNASCSWDDRQLCPVCLTNLKNMAFGCGHQTCYDCGPKLQACPICRSEILTRIRLY